MPMVHDLMTRAVITVKPDQQMGEVTRIMNSSAVRHLAVIDDAQHLLGVISAHDVHVSAATLAADAMSRNPVTVTPTTPGSEAVVEMLQHRINSLPVVDAERRLVGILTSTDLLMVAYDALRKAEITRPLSKRIDVEHTVLLSKLQRVRNARHADTETIALRELGRFLQRRYDREQAAGGLFASWLESNPGLCGDVAEMCEQHAQIIKRLESLEAANLARAKSGPDEPTAGIAELISAVEEHEATKAELDKLSISDVA
jgi:CBS domain-containing protein